MSIYYPINGLLLRYEIMGKQQSYLPMDKLPNELMGMNAQFIMQPDLVCGRPVIVPPLLKISANEQVMNTKSNKITWHSKNKIAPRRKKKEVKHDERP